VCVCVCVCVLFVSVCVFQRNFNFYSDSYQMDTFPPVSATLNICTILYFVCATCFTQRINIYWKTQKNIYNSTNHKASPRSYLPHSNIVMEF
jgi:lysylphosphatidylglycerol synthetase-like protein (DUF2156 family)